MRLVDQLSHEDQVLVQQLADRLFDRGLFDMWSDLNAALASERRNDAELASGLRSILVYLETVNNGLRSRLSGGEPLG